MLISLTSAAASSSGEEITKQLNEVSKPVSFDWSSLIQWFNNSLPGLVNIGIKVVLALVVFFVGRRIIHALKKPIRRMIDRTSLDTGVKQFVSQVIGLVLYVVLILLILAVFGIPASNAAAVIASLGLTAGLALQGSLSNFAGGFLILILHPFRVGDYIREDSNGNEGIVEEIQLCYTKLKTSDQKILVLPNGALSNSSLTNFSRNGHMAVNFSLKVPLNTDTVQIQEDLKEILNRYPNRCSDVPVSAFIKGLTGDGADIGYRMYVPVSDYWNCTGIIYEEVRRYLIQAKIPIPSQHMEIRLEQQPPV
jgi:small conductance mechanosensitive channel